MPYNKTPWVNDQYDTPADTFTIEDLGGGQFRIQRAGTRTVQGTPLSAANLNKAETQYDAAKADLDAHRAAATIDHPDGSVTDAKIGSRTPDQAVAAAGGAQTLSALLSMIVNRIKTAMGTANWYDAGGADKAAGANSLAQRDANGDLTARRLISSIANGTAPLAVTSQTVVTNLNADMVDGQHIAGTVATIASGTKTKIQCGTATSVGFSSASSFSFAVAFGATPTMVLGCYGSDNDRPTITAISSSGFSLKNALSSHDVFWIAIGA